MPPYSKCNIKNKKEERNFSSFLSDLDTLRNAKHVVYDWRSKYPKVDRYLNTGRLIRLRNRILVTMEFERHTTSHHQDVPVSYNIPLYKDISRNRWNPWEDRPIETASELCMNWRRVVNSDESRSVAVLEIMEDHPKVIIFYNFDYELDILKNLGYPDGTEVAEWNGHKHQEIPTGDKWVYLVQYTAGCEGWNCITTDTIIFYSQNYWPTSTRAGGTISSTSGIPSATGLRDCLILR